MNNELAARFAPGETERPHRFAEAAPADRFAVVTPSCGQRRGCLSRKAEGPPRSASPRRLNKRRMSNVECRRNDEARMTKVEPRIAHSSLEHSSLFRHSTFVLRHCTALFSYEIVIKA